MNRIIIALAICYSLSGLTNAQELPFTLIIEAEITEDSILSGSDIASLPGVGIVPGAPYRATIRVDELIEIDTDDFIYSGSSTVNVGTVLIEEPYTFEFLSPQDQVGLIGITDNGHILGLLSNLVAEDGSDDVLQLITDRRNLDDFSHAVELIGFTDVDVNNLNVELSLQPTLITIVPEPSGYSMAIVLTTGLFLSRRKSWRIDSPALCLV